MVEIGSASDRGKAMLALHEALVNVCNNSDWIYSVFWSIRPRPRHRGGCTAPACRTAHESLTLMLMWEDGYCRTEGVKRLPPNAVFNFHGDERDLDVPLRKAFRKMSIQLYNYGEGLMGKVASDKCHKWVCKNTYEEEEGASKWQSSFEAYPPEWQEQFAAGIQTIVVLQAGQGLLQLGSCNKIKEDLSFVLRMRQTFESLSYDSAFYLSHLFAPPPSDCNKKHDAIPVAPVSTNNWNNFRNPTHPPSLQTSNALESNNGNADKTPTAIPSPALPEAENLASNEGIKWSNGLPYLAALTAKSNDKNLFFGPQASDSIAQFYQSQLRNHNLARMHEISHLHNFKHSATMPATASLAVHARNPSPSSASPASSTHLSAQQQHSQYQNQDQHQHEQSTMGFCTSVSGEENMYSNLMQGFLK